MVLLGKRKGENKKKRKGGRKRGKERMHGVKRLLSVLISFLLLVMGFYCMNRDGKMDFSLCVYTIL